MRHAATTAITQSDRLVVISAQAHGSVVVWLMCVDVVKLDVWVVLLEHCVKDGPEIGECGSFCWVLLPTV